MYLMKVKLLHLGLQKGRPLVMTFILSPKKGSKENRINSLKFFWKRKVAFVALILACCAFLLAVEYKKPLPHLVFLLYSHIINHIMPSNLK